MCIRDRGDGDDVAVAAGDHARQEAARGAKEGQGIDVEGAADALIAQLQQRLAGDDAGVVDERCV